ncbi:hypothetical protein [Henriciella marina]|uniref:hypothetical protein n=1 Tax=Henriciella marina TaxID=453851 RepID=UPI00036B594B|nr:hypothetical protein [Henriciella marina]
MDQAAGFALAMTDVTQLGMDPEVAVLFGTKAGYVLALGLLVVALPRSFTFAQFLDEKIWHAQGIRQMALKSGALAYMVIGLFFIGLIVSAQNYSPFLYFQF